MISKEHTSDINYDEILSGDSNRLRLPFWLSKITRFEFWPYQVLYFPVFIYYLWLSLKARSFTFFTAANPGIHLGGVIGESKTAILKEIDPAYLPKTLTFKADTPTAVVLRDMQKSGIDFPCIIKPDVGERGTAVEKIESEKALYAYLSQYNHDVVIQSFIDEPIEAGVLYYRMPDGSTSGITSVVLKSFLSVTGNGYSSMEELIRNSERAQLRLNYLLDKFAQELHRIPIKGEEVLLEPIGNHCRGTLFLGAQELINAKLVQAFDQIAETIDGFYIGRFDLKVNCIEDLWHPERIRIMELNGVTSEPGHIYDPECTLLQAYAALFRHYRLLYEIGVQNKKRGVAYASFSEVWSQLRNNL
jgi:hypothetical protein